ncbi:MAG: hypothetical protein LRY72_18220 [Saccharospirillaceae bacterium]|nr:hypothetical protein [Saccharospirillaceae bacterium]
MLMLTTDIELLGIIPRNRLFRLEITASQYCLSLAKRQQYRVGFSASPEGRGCRAFCQTDDAIKDLPFASVKGMSRSAVVFRMMPLNHRILAVV